MWHSTQVGDAGQNYSGFTDIDLDQCMEEARRSTDPTHRTELYNKFQKIFAEQVPALVINYPVYNYAISRLLHGVQLGPMLQPSDRFRTIDRWYIATRRVIQSVGGQETGN
jgi:peptide/nickel transport system substrate-binding protein